MISGMCVQFLHVRLLKVDDNKNMVTDFYIVFVFVIDVKKNPPYLSPLILLFSEQYLKIKDTRYQIVRLHFTKELSR